MPISKLGQRRQVVIPKDICENLGLETGDFVEIIQDGGRIVIKPKQVVDPEDTLSPEDEEAVRQGIADIERGDVRPWSEVKHDKLAWRLPSSFALIWMEGSTVL